MVIAEILSLFCWSVAIVIEAAANSLIKGYSEVFHIQSIGDHGLRMEHQYIAAGNYGSN